MTRRFRRTWLAAMIAIGSACGAGAATTPDGTSGSPDGRPAPADVDAAPLDPGPADAGVDDPGPETALVTGVGTPTGMAVVQTLDAGGGVISEPVSGSTVRAVAGSLGVQTQITMTPVANLVPGGVGDGVAIAVAGGAAQAQPLLVQFRYGDDVTDPSLIVLAIQADDGSWAALTPMHVDTDAKILSAAMPDFVSAKRARLPDVVSMSSRTVIKYLGTYMTPATATVKTKGTVGLVPYATVSQTTCEDQPVVCHGDLCELVKAKCSKPIVHPEPLINSKAGYIRTWYVDNVLQGDANLGTAQPSGSVGGIYTAPGKRPSAGKVTVEFISVNQKTGETTKGITAVVKITAGGWVGTTRGESFQWDTDAEVTWTPIDGDDGDILMYEPSGTLTLSNFNGAQVGCSLSPLSGAIGTADGLLIIDFGADPPTYTGSGFTSWGGTLACEGGSMGIPVGDAWFGDDSSTLHTLGDDGTTLSGGWTNSDESLTWSFHQL